MLSDPTREDDRKVERWYERCAAEESDSDEDAGEEGNKTEKDDGKGVEASLEIVEEGLVFIRTSLMSF